MNPTPFDLLIIRRCLKIATFGGRDVKSNPQVGAVITYEDRIIGEGWHHKHGGPHAEREALSSVREEDRQYLNRAHLYVSLEPCNHHGKTPPCVDAILSADIPQVSIAMLDPTPRMSGMSVETLRSNGVIVNVLEPTVEAKSLLAPFYAQHIEKRPFVLLKYAISKDGYMGQVDKQVWLSNALSKLTVHSSRSELDGILIGTNTAIIDNPRLTTRLVDGDNPLRIVLDRDERIPKDTRLLSDQHKTLIVTTNKEYAVDDIRELLVLDKEDFQLPIILNKLLRRGINSVMVEGGKAVLKSFINLKLWDECHLYKTNRSLQSGIKAPLIKGKLQQKTTIRDNKLLIISNL